MKRCIFTHNIIFIGKDGDFIDFLLLCISSITLGFLPSPLKNQRKVTLEKRDLSTSVMYAVAELLLRLACACRKYLSVNLYSDFHRSLCNSEIKKTFSIHECAIE
jgi:hypothetical protein